ncbi:MAG: hypothetical protein JSS50_01715 [Proteobacteria bacterium]|nr:hypothetical protein [Pseudomonadota bacterium]
MGTAQSKRQLYTDGTEYSMQGCNPCIISGIGNIIEQPDLIDRCLFITLLPISSDKRVAIADLRQEFQKDRGKIFGALCKAISCALRRKANVELSYIPRMMDAGRFISAASESFGWNDNDFVEAYKSMMEGVFLENISQEPVIQAIMQHMQGQEEVTTTYTHLLVHLKNTAMKDLLPKNPSALSRRINKIAPLLRKAGFHIRCKHAEEGNYITITKQKPSVAS